MLALYITINLEIRSLDYENCNCSASNEQFQSAHSSLLLTENVLTCWITLQTNPEWGKGGPFGILARGPTATLLRHCNQVLFHSILLAFI